MEYDEIRITTRREIAVCKGAIQRLERVIAALERRYGKKTVDLLGELGDVGPPPEGDFRLWYDTSLALRRWDERLRAHQEILKL